MTLPTMFISFQYNHTITCVFKYKLNASTTEECSKYITQPKPADYGTYVGYFAPPFSLKVIPPENSEEGIRGVLFSMAITDARPIDTTIHRMVLLLLDTETYVKADNKSIDAARKIDPTFVNSVMTQTDYIIFYRQSNYLTYTRSVRGIIKPNILADFGFSQTIYISYLNTALTSGPLAENYNIIKPNIYGTVDIKPSSFLVRTDTERRSNTVLGSLGLLGGAWSLALIAYATLFGSKSLTPWGLIHSYCCCFVRSTRSRFRESFSTIPLQSSSSSTSDLSILSSDLSYNDNALQQRLDALELFLKEYVVDQTYLEDLNANKYSSKISEFLGNWTWKSRKRNDSSTSDATLPQVSSTENDSSTIDTTQPQVSSTDSPNIRDISNYQLPIPNLHNDNTLL
ncbi:9543_t:CDS:2 [Paraglomus brasilianum]|uniref:9543_t:CDS:1 n=1 Tax=Paraglomus brasilianum TaxID=144538 RepID=A0A9N9CI56_9GLOM|nr:9543_t:CDS:2 [Paraglomus brasilianum]